MVGSSIFSLDTIKNIIPAIKNAYISFYNFYFSDDIFNNLYWHRNIFNGIVFAMISINFIILIINNKIYKSPAKLISLVLMILLFPLFTCSIQILAQARSINLLMASSLYFPIVLLLKQIEIIKISKLNNIVNIISILVCTIIIWTYILADNATYVATDLFNKQMYSVGTRIVQEINNHDEITDDMQIAVLGKMDFSLQNDNILKFTNFDVSNINIWTWQIFLQDKLGLGRNICTFEEYQDIIDSQEFIDMPIFPNKDSIKVINGIGIVKLNY